MEGRIATSAKRQLSVSFPQHSLCPRLEPTPALLCTFANTNILPPATIPMRDCKWIATMAVCLSECLSVCLSVCSITLAKTQTHVFLTLYLHTFIHFQIRIFSLKKKYITIRKTLCNGVHLPLIDPRGCLNTVNSPPPPPPDIPGHKGWGREGDTP